MMKRVLAAALLLALLLPLSGLAAAKKVTFGSVTVSADATKVNLGSQKVTDLNALCKFLNQLPNVKKFDMYQTNMTSKWAETLSRKYPQIEFGWTFRIPCSNKPAHIIRTNATAFSTLHNNKSRLHTTAELEVLKYCKHLKAVDIGHNGVTDISFLSSLPELRVLIIGRNRITDLSPLKKCTKLEYLEAFSNQIESIKPLLSCKHLMDLNVPNNRIKDPQYFSKLTSLKRLWAYNYAWQDMKKNYVPASVKNQVKKALPKCVTNWTQAGVQDGKGTWRDHAHYLVIAEMFQSGKYIPFADSYQEP